MPLAKRLKLLVVLWALLELAVFVAVVRAAGIAGAFLLGVITTLMGAGLLKRVGATAVMRLRASLPRDAAAARTDLLDGTLLAIAAVALLLPGFLSDAIGLALTIPAVRAVAIRRVRALTPQGTPAEPRSRRGPGSIDLAPEEWSTTTRPTGVVLPDR